jgi:hypothetical protein
MMVGSRSIFFVSTESETKIPREEEEEEKEEEEKREKRASSQARRKSRWTLGNSLHSLVVKYHDRVFASAGHARRSRQRVVI